MSTPPRRELLAGAPTTPHPDAELIVVCAKFDRLEHRYIAIGGHHAAGSPAEDGADAKRARITEAQSELVDRMIKLRAVTLEGHAARAHSLALWDAEMMKPGTTGDTGTRLTAAIVRDLLA